jgi:DNA-binding SARP family transcriptional activator
VANAGKTADKLGALEKALTLWTGPALEEFQSEEWARGESARLTEIHAASVDDYIDLLLSAHRATDAIAAAEVQIRHYPYRDRSRGLLIRALALTGRQADALRRSRPTDRYSSKSSVPSPRPRSSGPNAG